MGIFDFEAGQLLRIAAVGVVFHVLWLLLSLRMNALYLLAGVIMLIGPWSLASDLGEGVAIQSYGMLKVGRIYLSVLMMVVGFLLIREGGLGLSGCLFIIAVVFYVMGALWGPYPVKGVLYKGLLITMFTAGVMLGWSCLTFRDLQRAVRIFLFPAAIWTFAIILWMAAHPFELRSTRIRPWGINSNGLAAFSAVFLTISTYIALYDSSKFFKILAYIVGTLSACIIPFTGSRGGFGMALVAVACVAFPLVRRPGLLIAVFTVVFLTYYGVKEYVQTEQSERLKDFSIETRMGPWRDAWEYFKENPVIGQGWVYTLLVRNEPTTKNLHSMYFQVLVEVGIIGFLLMMASFTVTFLKLINGYRLAAAASKTLVAPCFLALAFFASNLASGLFEFGPFSQSGIQSILFGWSIGLVDRIPLMVRAWEAENLQPQQLVEYVEWDYPPQPVPFGA
jgi:O-antigen ligase